MSLHEQTEDLPSAVETDEEGASEGESDKLLDRMNDRYEEATIFDDDNYTKAADDLSFLDGEGQWNEMIKQQRQDQDRPCLTINRLPTFVDRVTGAQQEMEFRIQVKPVDMGPDEQPPAQNVRGDDYDIAQVYEGIIRNIEYASDATHAYLNSGQNAAESGFGYFRVITEYVSDDVFEQDLRIRPIIDPLSVHLDPKTYTQGPEYCDYGFVTQSMNLKDYKRRYPGKTHAADFDDPTGRYAQWFKDDQIIIAEYFERVRERGTIYLLTDGRVVRHDKFEQIKDELKERGVDIERQRETEFIKTLWYKVTPTDILKGPVEFPSRYVPIVPVLGKHTVVNGYPRFRGVIRNAKDAQRMFNVWRSASTEFVALQPKSPFLVGTSQLGEGKLRRKQFGKVNTHNLAFLEYDDSKNAKPPQRSAPPQSATGMINESLQANEDMKGTTGIFDPSLGNVGNEQSGRAILARQAQSDIGTNKFIGNLARGIRYAGKILIDAIPRVYDSERVLRIRNSDDVEDYIRVNQTVRDEETGEEIILNDLSVGRYDVAVDAGPSSQTQREEAASSLLEFFTALAQANPQAAGSIMDMVAGNLDFPGADKVAERLQKLVPPEMLEKDDENQDDDTFNAGEVQQAIEQALQAAGVDLEQYKAQTERLKAEADRKDALADQVKANAELLEQLQQNQITEAGVQQMIEAAIGQVLATVANPGQVNSETQQ